MNDVERTDFHSEASPEARCLTLKQKWLVIKNLGLSEWLQRTQITSGAIVCISFAISSIATAIVFLAIGLSYSAALISCGVATVVGAFGWGFFRQENGRIRDWRRNASIGFLGAPVLVVIAVNAGGLGDKLSRTPIAASQPPTTTPTASRDCYAVGESLAAVYLANARKLAEGSLMASDVMNAGCERQAEAAANPKSCTTRCEAGFRATVKHAWR